MQIAIGIAVLAGASLGPAWLAVPLHAQDRATANWDYKVEVFGDIGMAIVMNLPATTHTNGTGFAGGVGWRPLRAAGHGLGLEVRAARVAYDGAPGGNGGVTAATDYDRWHATLAAAGLTYHFWSRSRVQPYLLGGFGYMATSGSYLCTTCLRIQDSGTGATMFMENRLTGSDSDIGALVGGGLKVAATRHVFFRAEFFEFVTTQKARTGWEYRLDGVVVGGDFIATQGRRLFWESSTIGMGIRF